MKRKQERGAALLLALLMAGCNTQRPTSLPAGAAAYQAIPVDAVPSQLGEIGPGDRLSIKVLGEPDLTSDQYIVDEAGQLDIPLVGNIRATGLSPEALRRDIAQRLGARYIRNPHVAENFA